MREDINHFIDVATIIDQQPIGSFQIRIVVLCALAQFLDGFDTQAIAYVGPSLARAWHLQRGVLGSVFGAGILGIIIGTLFIGPLADWFGRKKLMIAGMLMIAVFSFFTARATSLPQLLIFRFLTGLGLGSVVPGSIVITNEYSPHRSRGTMVTLMACGYAVGAASGGLMTAALLRFGWPMVFYVGALAPLLLSFVLLVWLPESVRLLIVNHGSRVKIVHILRQMNPKLLFGDDVEFVVPMETRKRMPVFQLFENRRARTTVFLWLAFFSNLLGLNFLANWLPTVINSAGLSVQQAVKITTLFQFGGMVGVITMGVLADRFDFYRVLAAGFTLAAIFTALVGSVGRGIPILAATICITGYFIIGVQMTLCAFSVTLYPTAIRSTGSSWALGVGRVGSFLGPVLGGILLSLQLPLQTLLYVAALPALLGTCAIAFMARERRIQSIENQQVSIAS